MFLRVVVPAVDALEAVVNAGAVDALIDAGAAESIILEGARYTPETGGLVNGDAEIVADALTTHQFLVVVADY